MGVPKDPEKYEAMRTKQRQRAQERWKNPEYREKVSGSFFKKGNVPLNTGKPLSEERKEQLAASHRGQAPWNKGIHTGHVPWNKGTHINNRSPEASARAAESNRGKKREPGFGQKLSQILTGKKRTLETRARISEVQKGKSGNRKDTKQSSAAIEKMRAARLGTKHTPEWRAEMRTIGRARWEKLSEDEKAKKVGFLRESTRNITNSWIENAYAQLLDEQGIVYERQKRIGWYKVDFYIPSENRVVELNGCYWHGCYQCERIREDYEQKREADKKRYDYLQRKGYVVEIVWEHDLPRKPWKPP